MTRRTPRSTLFPYTTLFRSLKLPSERLSKLADLQRTEELKRNLADPPTPLFREVRELILRKCVPDREKQIRAILEKQPFGELERLVAQKLLDVVKRVAKEELNSENGLHLVARLTSRSYEQVRVNLLEFLDTDIFNLSPQNCVSFLDPLIETWDVDPATFSMEVVLNRRLAPGDPKRFEFVERPPDPVEREPGLRAFLNNSALSGTATKEEVDFLKKLRFNGKRPTSLYYYRELQNLRDPIHFDAEKRSSIQDSSGGAK